MTNYSFPSVPPLPGYEYVVSGAADLYERIDAGDVLEVFVARCGKDGIELRNGYVAVLYKGEWGEDGKRKFCIDLSPISDSVESLELRRGSVYCKDDRDLELIASDDTSDDNKFLVFFPTVVLPKIAEDIGVWYRQRVLDSLLRIHTIR